MSIEEKRKNVIHKISTLSDENLLDQIIDQLEEPGSSYMIKVPPAYTRENVEAALLEAQADIEAGRMHSIEEVAKELGVELPN